MLSENAQPAWAKGRSVDELRRWASIFAEHDEGLILGAFTKVKEAHIATWLEEGRIVGGPASGIAIVWRTLRSKQWVKDFTGERRCLAPPGTIMIERVAYRREAEAVADAMIHSLCGFAHGAVILQLFQEHPGDQRIAANLGFDWICTKIRASSELIGCYQKGLPAWGIGLSHPAERAGILRLEAGIAVAPVAEALESAPDFAQHYSSYNKRHSWTAIALRGFSDDPLFIQKPAEMSRKWKADNPELLAAEPRFTAAWEQFEPLIAPILERMPADQFERIRFMRLDPGGELTRHADITDRDAGLDDGKLARLHVPIVSNEGVVFTSWLEDGSSETCHMGEGELWYLDQRKPHAARNQGALPRVHLVVDCVSTALTRQAIAESFRLQSSRL